MFTLSIHVNLRINPPVALSSLPFICKQLSGYQRAVTNKLIPNKD